MAFVNSSGYAGLTDTPLARVGYAKTFVRRFFCNGMIPDITYSDYDTELVQCNQIVQFTKQPIVRWKPYQKNQDLIPQEVDLDNFCFELCEADYVSIKIDTMDEKYLCERFKEWEASVMLSVQQDKEQRLNRYVLGRLPLEVAPQNTGLTAGYDTQVSLGSSGSPVTLTPNTFVQQISYHQLVLTEACAWEDGKMALVVPPAFYNLLLNGPLSNALTMGNCVNCSSQITGKAPGQVMGFDVYKSTYAPKIVGGSASWILAGRKDATMFAEDIITSRIIQSTKGFWKEYQMLMVYGEKTIQPQAWTAGAYIAQQTN